MRHILVCGAGGFIGSHLVRRLKRDGHWVRGVDLEFPRFSPTPADEFIRGDLRDLDVCHRAVDGPVEAVYQLAADMGGAEYVFGGRHDAAILHNSTQITLNVLAACRARGVKRVFYASSACVYPRALQDDAQAPDCREDRAYPADPDSDYGFEKLYGERLCLAHARNCGMEVRIARYHNIYGPEGVWDGGREKVPAALCRKVAQAAPGRPVEIIGDGKQTRSFLYIDDAVEATLRLMESDFAGPVNIGSEEMVSIDALADLIAAIAGKTIEKDHVPGPTGVRGRTSDNTLIRRRLGWEPRTSLAEGLRATYPWVAAQVARADSAVAAE